MAAPEAQPMIGQTLGHYRITAKLGEGGMGVVYRARDEVLHRDIALKVLASNSSADAQGPELLMHEARAASALNHPNICTIHEVGEAGGTLFIVMELIEGAPLAALIGGSGLPIASVVRYGVQIADALAHAHNRGVAHRDLKSANVAVTPEGLVKVLDFGLARRLPWKEIDHATRSMESLENAGGLSGTLSYMPPEVLRGEAADERGDLWALGVVLYEALSGQLPFRGRTSFEVTSSILNELPPPLPSHVPLGLSAIVRRCLTKEPAQRYQRAGEVSAALEAAQSAAIASPEISDEQRGPRTTVLRGIRHISVKPGTVLLLVGTTKGAFLLRSSPERSRWEVGGPYFPGHAVYTMAYDDRDGRHRLWASTYSYWGTLLRSTDDFGKSWTNPGHAGIKFPAESGLSLKNIWQIGLAPNQPDTLYCGVEPAALFESHDAGESWSLVQGLFDHPHRPRWVPGNGGLCLHTIVPHPVNPERMHVAISAAGVYRTNNGGRNWEARNRGIRVVFMPEKYPEFGQCVHKIVVHPAQPDRFFLQNHWGLYRSDDAADTWRDIANGVPSDFGFAMVMHPHDPDCVYIFPVESDEFRCSPEGRLRVYRTRNGGASWEPLARGLPQKGAYETVLRDAMVADSLDPAGIYFGTRSGKLYGSRDEGKTWEKILEGLPSIVCVKTAMIGEPRMARKAKTPRTATQAASRGKASVAKGRTRGGKRK